MSREEVKQKLADYIRGRQGLKAMDLASDVTVMNITKGEPLHELLEELVSESRVMEIEYSTPSIPYRLKSFFLPEGSVVHRVRGKSDNS